MSNTRRPAPTRAKTKPKGNAEPIPLDIPLPGGGRALFHHPDELTPRDTRDLDVLLTVHGDRMKALHDGDTSPLTRAEATEFLEMNDLAAFAYWREWRGSDGAKRDMPGSVDDLTSTVPTRVYKTVVGHAAKLLASALSDDFSVDALPDDLDDAADDLPTSA